MTLADIRQEYLQRHFRDGVGRIAFAPEVRQPQPACLLLDYKGVLASDKQQPHDIASRAAANRAYKPVKAPVAERARLWMEQHPNLRRVRPGCV
ncbi:hypothetical protein AB7813_12655 [Tardiphaga sp. 20_F10_N6_6]|uniref:hypothetical protein n=1 Tax=Tardiphaga sp. 20_F10_N6_6 TaxID=3240788 RepID=UPI003F890B10